MVKPGKGRVGADLSWGKGNQQWVRAWGYQRGRAALELKDCDAIFSGPLVREV